MLTLPDPQSAMQKVDAIMAENPDMSLDELVAARKINNDQKSQALKKPSLHESLARFEDQIAQYKKFEEDFEKRAGVEKEELQAAHQKELETLRSSLTKEAAAARRQLEDDSSDESKAFEGVLLLLYGGDEAAVDAAEKLIDGAGEGVTSTEGTPLDVTCAYKPNSVNFKDCRQCLTLWLR